MFKRFLTFYSHLFRYIGLLFAMLSAALLIDIGVGVARFGYVLVNESPSASTSSLLAVLGMPFLGVVLGSALFYFLPRMHGDDS